MCGAIRAYPLHFGQNVVGIVVKKFPLSLYQFP